MSSSAIRTHALSPTQERKLVDFIDDKLLDVTRNFKKRNYPSETTLPTLDAYLDAAHPLLALILQIPPIAPQAALRTALLLRLTGELLGSVPGYPPAAASLAPLLAWLDELDRGWAAVLRAQAWDPAAHAGVDLGASHAHMDVDADVDVDMDVAPRAPVSQTDRARLRSLLVSGTVALEAWLEGLHVDGGVPDDLEDALARLGLQQAFDGLFERTLNTMGELAGEVLSCTGEVEM